MWAHFGLTEAKWKTVLWSVEFEILFRKHGRRVLWKDHPACSLHSVQSLMVWRWISAYVIGSWHIWKGSISGERYIRASEQHANPYRQDDVSKAMLKPTLYLLLQRDCSKHDPNICCSGPCLENIYYVFCSIESKIWVSGICKWLYFTQHSTFLKMAL